VSSFDRTVLAAAIVAAVVTLGPSARADAPGAPSASERSEELRARAERALATNERERSIRADWQRTYRDLLAELRDASARHNEATRAQTKAKSRIRYQGQQRTAIEEEMRDSAQTIDSLKEEISEFHERAREASISGAWLDEVEEEFEMLRGILPRR